MKYQKITVTGSSFGSIQPDGSDKKRTEIVLYLRTVAKDPAQMSRERHIA